VAQDWAIVPAGGTRRLKPGPWESGSHETPRWRGRDSNPRSLSRKSCSSWSASAGNVEAPDAKLSVFPSSWGAREPAQRKYGYQVDARPQDEVYDQRFPGDR